MPEFIISILYFLWFKDRKWNLSVLGMEKKDFFLYQNSNIENCMNNLVSVFRQKGNNFGILQLKVGYSNAVAVYIF